MAQSSDFEIRFTSKEVSAWLWIALLKQMTNGLGLKQAMTHWHVPAPGLNRGYAPAQLLEQRQVSIWTGANRFVQTNITRLDGTLARLFGWEKVSGHKAIVRLFQRFDQHNAIRMQQATYQWMFEKLALNSITLDVDSTVLTRWSHEIEGAKKGYSPKYRGQGSHHPLLAFVADWRLVANFWLRPGDAFTINDALSFIESTLTHLGSTHVGLFRAHAGFYDKDIVKWLKEREVSYIISAKLAQKLQHNILTACLWQAVVPGIEVSELKCEPHGWGQAQRVVVIRQHIDRKQGRVGGKNLTLFADAEDLQGWHYSTMITDLSLAATEVWRLYRGRADCENRIKELKYDFGLDSIVLRQFWATEVALSVVMLASNLMNMFRNAVIRQKSHQRLSTLHHSVLAIGAYWSRHKENSSQKPRLNIAVARRRRLWFKGLWSNAQDPVEWAYHSS